MGQQKNPTACFKTKQNGIDSDTGSHTENGWAFITYNIKQNHV